jgi:hypothetical protein
MRARGIAYDTGFFYQGAISRERFDPEMVRRELAIIRDDLRCNAVQVIGGDPERLELAASCAAGLGGKITYAAIPPERVDWTPFDIVSVELIRSAEVAGQFREGVRTLVAGGKPVAITGFGAATYRGAGDRGGRAMEIIESDKDTGAPVRLDGEYVRDEAGQATYR